MVVCRGGCVSGSRQTFTTPLTEHRGLLSTLCIADWLGGEGRKKYLHSEAMTMGYGGS